MALKIETSKRSPNYSKGRPAGPPAFIVIHHWGSDGQKFDNVVSWLCRSGGNSSAHYVVQGGRVAELVSPNDRAWHAGSGGNPRGIGIECRPEASAADVATVAELVRVLRNRYGQLPLRKHSDFMSTDCPGRWASLLGKIDALASGNAAAADDSTRFTSQNVKQLQTRLKTPVDGVISSQPSANKSILWGVESTAVDWVPAQYVRGSLVVRAVQQRLNASQGAGLAVDGLAGPLTVKAVQRFLNKKGAGLEVDGIFGALSAAAARNWLAT